MTREKTDGTGIKSDHDAMHAALIDALAAVELSIVRLKTEMVDVGGEALEPLLGDAARLTERRAQILADLAPLEAALVARRCRELEAARDNWVAEVAALQADGHLPADEEVH